MMNEIKVGDRVKQVRNIYPPESPYVRITRIEGRSVYHIHDGSTVENSTSAVDSFVPITEEGTVDKYTELKQRIEGLKNGWDKEADDILKEINDGYPTTPIHISSYIGAAGNMEVRGTDRGDILQTTHFGNQCNKLTTFKSTLLWLLDHSSIKKDERQEKISILENCVKEAQKAFEAQIRELQRQIEELKK